MAYRNDGEAREMLNESLEIENKLLVSENEELREKVKTLESDKTRLQMIAGELLADNRPSAKMPMIKPKPPEAAEAERYMRDAQRMMREVEATRTQIRWALISLGALFAAYHMLVQLLSP